MRSRPSPLAAVQALMAKAVMRPLASGDGSQARWSDGTATAQVAEGFIKPNDRLDSFERLQIYNQQYWWRLEGAFREDFPGLRAALGERRFRRLAIAYLDAHGSQSWTLRNLGRQLEEFIHEHPHLTAPYTALALDTARLEWASVLAFDEQELPRLTAAKMAGLSPSLVRLRLQPYLSLLELSHPADHLLQRVKRRAAGETGAASNAVSAGRNGPRARLSVMPSDTPIYLAVHRVDFSVYYKRLEPAAWRILTALRAGQTLDDACAQGFSPAAESEGLDPGKLQQWFADWMRFGWFAAAGA